MFEQIQGAPPLSLTDARRFASGALALIYTPKNKVSIIRKCSLIRGSCTCGVLHGHG